MHCSPVVPAHSGGQALNMPDKTECHHTKADEQIPSSPARQQKTPEELG